MRKTIILVALQIIFILPHKLQAQCTAFAVGGGGSFCSGASTGPSITLSGSQTGVTYQLKNGTSSIGVSLAGTGSKLTWPNINIGGTYTVVATNSSINCSQVMTGTAVVTVHTVPAVFTLSGGGEVCEGYGTGGITVGLSGSQLNVHYTFYVDGIVRYVIYGTGSPLTLQFPFIGTYLVIASTDDNSCTQTMDGKVGVIENKLPDVLLESGGGLYCGEGVGLPIAVSSSEIGINYQLRNGVDNVGAVVAGTGSNLIWNDIKDAGEYSILATNPITGCLRGTGPVDVRSRTALTQFTVSGGGSYCQGSVGLSVTLNGSENNVYYTLQKDGADYYPAYGTGNSISWNGISEPGAYTIKATDISLGCTSDMLGNTTISIGCTDIGNDPAPPALFTVSGGGVICSSEESRNIVLSGSETGVSYQLSVDGNNIGGPLTGTGNELTWVNLSIDGQYSIVATRLESGRNRTMAGTADIFYDLPKMVSFIGTSGAICSGTAGIPIFIENSEAESRYQLQINGVNSGEPFNGNGETSMQLPYQTQEGTYTIVGTKISSGCSLQMDGSVTIAIYPPLNKFNITGGGSYCAGTKVSIGLSGSEVGVNYQLKKLNTNLGIVAGTGSPLTWPAVTSGGSYKITGTNVATGCTTVIGSATITINALPALYKVSGSGTICSGELSVMLSSSQVGVNYQIKNGLNNVGPLVSGTDSTLTWSNELSEGSYTILATNSTTGCSRSMNGTATLVTTLPRVFTVTGGGSMCPGDAGVLITLNNSQTGVTYQLKNDTTNVGGPILGTNASLTWQNQTEPGTYSVIATDVVTNCTAIMNNNAVVMVNPMPVVNASADVLICQNQSTTISVSGDAAQYTWSGDLGSQQTIEVSPTITTLYTVTGTSSAGCQARDSVTVTVDSPTASITPSLATVCSGASIDLRGSGGVVYTWSDGSVTSSIKVAPPITTVYVLNVVDALGCPATAQATITVLPSPIITVSPDLAICQGQGAGMSVSGDSTNQYLWDYGLGTETSVEATPVSTTRYTVTGTAPNGCQAVEHVNIFVNPLPHASISPASPVICQGSSIKLTASGGVIYQWNDGGSVQTREVRPSSDLSYTVSVTDIKGCTDTYTTTVSVDTECPSAPEEVRATSLTASQIMVTWQNTATNLTGFKVERALGSGAFGLVGTIDASTTTFIDNTLQPATLYRYRVRAYNSRSQSPESDEDDEATFNADQNYVGETVVLKDNVTDPTHVSSLAVGERINSWSYLDAQTNPVQQVIQEYSPTQKDVIQPFTYDKLGRNAVSNLPYTVASSQPGSLRNNALGSSGEQPGFYNGSSTPVGVPTESLNPYTQTVFENSPLSRITEQSAQGSSWALSSGKTMKVNYDANISTDHVLQWYVTDNGIRADQYYAGTQLTRTSQTDEDQHVSQSFTDKIGRVIFKRSSISGGSWVSSYILYDDFGNVLCQLPPVLVSKAEAQAGFPKLLQQATLDNLCYQSKYDNRQRKISMKAPGLEPVYLVYDKWNRLVLSQDGNQRLANQWLFNKYDSWNRPVMTGLMTDSRTVEAIQFDMESESIRFETRTDGAGNFHGYSKQAFPRTIDVVLTVSYFDDYSFVDNQIGDARFHYKPSALSGLPVSESPRTAGFALGSKVKRLNTVNEWFWSVSYYDDDARLIQAIASNQLAGVDRSSQCYKFPGWVTNSNSIHFEGAVTKELTISKRYSYDHTGRLLKSFHQVGNNAEVLLAELQYNEVGGLMKKSIHQVNGSQPLQVMDYSYNIRGWLTGINTNTPTSSDPADYYRQEVAYEKTFSSSGQGRFDGTVSAMKWNDDLDTKEKLYSFTYDEQDRLKHADYAANKDGTGWDSDAGMYSEKNIGYDENGNINKLDRYNYVPIDFETERIDQLSYFYQTESNLLLRVTDDSGSLDHDKGFKDGHTSGSDYQYDKNGNVTSDANKGIAAIQYNFLNKPERVDFNDGSYVVYAYDAIGIKLSQTTYDHTTNITSTTDYVNGLIIKDNVLASLFHDEGRVVFAQGSIANAEYEYFLTDHLGSPRVVLQTKPATHKATATMEAEHADDEQSKFLRYDKVRLVNSNLFDHTNNGKISPSGIELSGNAIRLSGGENEKEGLAKSLSVMPGDKITMNVYAKYVDPTADQNTFSGDLPNLLAYLAGTLQAPTGIITDGLGYGTSTETFPSSYLDLLDKTTSRGGPKAYLNYLIFDRNFNFLNGGFVRLSAKPKEDGTNIGHELLTATIYIREAGYVYTYLSNEEANPVEVYFDDFSVEQIESPVKEINAYYPYGLIAYNWVREGTEEVNSKFQGKEFDQKTGWHDFGARQYDGALGRWLGADPAGQFASPYVGMGNNPGTLTDPDGRWAGWDDLVVAGVGFTYGYLSYGFTHNDWGGKALLNGGINAAMFELGYLTAGGGAAGIEAASAAGSGASAESASMSAATNYLATSAVSIAASQVMPSIPLYQSDNFSLSISPTFSLQGFGASLNASYTDGPVTIGAGVGVTGLYKGGYESRAGGGVSYFDGTSGGSIGFTKFGGKDPQTNWIVGYRNRKFSFKMTNDAFIDGDKYRTAAAEVGYSDFSFGMNIYTNEGSDRVDGINSKIWGPHIPSKGQGAGKDQGGWASGKRLSSNLYFGYRYGGVAYRAGTDAPAVQDFFQNGIHRYITKTTPYFPTDYETGWKPYYYQRSYDPFSLY